MLALSFARVCSGLAPFRTALRLQPLRSASGITVAQVGMSALQNILDYSLLNQTE